MTPKDIERLSAVMALACSVYRVPFTKELVGAYATVLDGDDMGMVEESARAHIRTSRFFPAPCDLLAGGKRDADLVALEAWHAIKKGEQAPHVELAEEALRLIGGRTMLRDLTIQDAPHRRREFVETFKALLAEDEKEGMMVGIESGDDAPS